MCVCYLYAQFSWPVSKVLIGKLLYLINRIARHLHNLNINPECIIFFEICIQQHILFKNINSTLFISCHLIKKKVAFEINIIINWILFHDMIQGNDLPMTTSYKFAW